MWHEGDHHSVGLRLVETHDRVNEAPDKPDSVNLAEERLSALSGAIDLKHASAFFHGAVEVILVVICVCGAELGEAAFVDMVIKAETIVNSVCFRS